MINKNNKAIREKKSFSVFKIRKNLRNDTLQYFETHTTSTSFQTKCCLLMLNTQLRQLVFSCGLYFALFRCNRAII